MRRRGQVGRSGGDPGWAVIGLGFGWMCVCGPPGGPATGSEERTLTLTRWGALADTCQYVYHGGAESSVTALLLGQQVNHEDPGTDSSWWVQ